MGSRKSVPDLEPQKAERKGVIMAQKYLITCALPYANGPVHMGHIAGVYLPGDIFTRFLRLKGEECIFICGTDDHGVPITISADQEKSTPAAIVKKYHGMQEAAFKGLGIEFDMFSGTSTCKHHRELSQEFFLSLQKTGHIEPRITAQYYCTSCERFLPDRYVEGQCPFCGAEDARGDQCEACGNALDSLKDPKCKICGKRPEKRKTKHWFLRLDKYQDLILDWLNSKTNWKDNVRKFATEMLKKGLRARSITRDIDWGIPVPVEGAEGKVLYVWFDAPIGYISFTKELGDRRNDPDLWQMYWKGTGTKLVHFIGKDNIVFHAVIWPSMLMGQEGYILPDEIPAFEFLNFKGDKFSKSKKHALWAHDYLSLLPADLARYYLTVVAPETHDTNWTWETFVIRVNSELADVLGNFVNRTVTFARKNFGGAAPEADGRTLKPVLEKIRAAKEAMDSELSAFHFKAALAPLIELAREGNRIFDFEKPWETINASPASSGATVAACLEISAAIGTMIFPFMPESAGKIRRWLGLSEKPAPEDWKAVGSQMLKHGTKLAEPEILFAKVELAAIEAWEEKQKPQETPPPAEKGPLKVTFDAFRQIDLRIAQIMKVEEIKGADKLYRIEIDAGDGPRTIVAGLRLHYPDPASLVGRRIVVVANLEPAKIRGITSTAMLLAAEHGGKVRLLMPDGDLPPGSKVS